MPELKHIGPFVELCRFDSWQMGEYIISLEYGIFGRGCVTICRGNELLRSWGIDATTTVILLYINYFIWAAEFEVVESIPQKGFYPKKKDQPSNDQAGLHEARPFANYAAWQDFSAPLMRHFKKYVQQVDVESIEKNLKAIQKNNLKRIMEFFDHEKQTAKKKK